MRCSEQPKSGVPLSPFHQRYLLLFIFAFVSSPPFAKSQAFTDPAPVKAWKVLEQGAAEKSSSARASTLTALGLVQQDNRAMDLAEKGLADEKAEVRAAAATALGKMGAHRSIPKLRSAVDDRDLQVAVAAANSLIELGDVWGFNLFYAVLTGQRKSQDGVIDAQLQQLKDPKKLAMMGFEEGISFIPFAGIGYEAYKRLSKHDPSPVRASAARLLAKDPDPRSADALVRATSDENWLIRLAALEAIGRRDDPALLGKIELSMADPNERVRATAAAAVIRLSKIPKLEGKK